MVVWSEIVRYRPGRYSWVYRINSQRGFSSCSEDLELGKALYMSPHELGFYNKSRGAFYNQLAEGERRVLAVELCYKYFFNS